MNTAAITLLATLRALEVELHHPGTRCDATRLGQLLHAGFHEVGRSGRAYARDTIIGFLAAQETAPQVESGDFRVAEIAPGTALLTYRSARRLPDGSLDLHTLRSSLWLRTDQGWQLRYHQGTPAATPW